VYEKRISIAFCHHATHCGAVVSQRQSRQGSLTNDHRMYELNRDMLSVSCLSSITKGEQSPSLREATCHSPTSLCDPFCLVLEERYRYCHALLEASRYQHLQV